jgi:hypothetical protein
MAAAEKDDEVSLKRGQDDVLSGDFGRGQSICRKTYCRMPP